MPAIGLRSRFFAIILFVVAAVMTASVLLYSAVLRRERMSLIDQQVRETATALVDSELGDLRKIDFDEAEDLISEELGGSRIGKFVVIRNAAGQVIFQTASARLLPISQFPQDPQWFEYRNNGKYIRGLNLKLPRIPDRFLQVGLLLDESIVDPDYFSAATLFFAACALLAAVVVSFLLTSFLLRPIANLERFLTEMNETSRRQSLLPLVPATIVAEPDPKSHDEFERMVANLNSLIVKVNKNYQFSRLWAYQMAHELKTPLSIANVEIERIQKRLGLSGSEFADLNFENQKIAQTISAFLAWAELENSTAPQTLFATRLGEVVKNVARRLDPQGLRLHLSIQGEALLACNPHHIEQLLQNLMRNALIHGAPEAAVQVQVNGLQLRIRNEGPSIPVEVRERLGEPFNRGVVRDPGVKGHGLGLAWVVSVCRLYDWKIDFQSQDHLDGRGETIVTIVFTGDDKPGPS